jgi:predicted GNAT superfamily acetyltransferase
VLDRVGHVAQMERPDLVARAVVAMLGEVAARASDAVVTVNPVADTPHPASVVLDRIVPA